MPAIGIGLVWLAYSAGLWGYCLIRGYNVTPKDLLVPSWPPPRRSGGGVVPGAEAAINGVETINGGGGAGKEVPR